MNTNKEILAVVNQMVSDGQISQDIAEKYFPEIKGSDESEDDRIRKDIISMCQTLGKEEWVAWLENQSEQKPAWSEDDEKSLLELSQCCDLNKTQVQWLLSLKNRVLPQSKQEWSEEDEEMRKRAICACNFTIDKTDRDGFSKHYQEARDWLRSLPIGFITNPNYNEGMIKLLINELQQIADNNEAPKQYAKEIEWLKSLRPHKQWKPSEEQMYNLSEAAHYRTPFWDCDILIGLYDDLKKLKEE